MSETIRRWVRRLLRREPEPTPHEPWYPNLRVFDVLTGERLGKFPVDPEQGSMTLPVSLTPGREYRVVLELPADDGTSIRDTAFDVSYVPIGDPS